MAKPNTWFTETFLPSFGNCNNQRISEKQASIFKRYLKFDGRIAYDGVIAGREIVVCYDRWRRNYYLSIGKDKSTERAAIKAKIKSLDAEIDSLCETDATESEIEAKESELKELNEQLGFMRFYNFQ